MSEITQATRFEGSPTVYGIETEYSCVVTLPGGLVRELVGSCHAQDAKLGLYDQPADKGTSSLSAGDINKAAESLGLFRSGSEGMLSNGARFYIDPSGPEYATPETRTAEEATHRTFDGDAIVLGMFEYLRRVGKIEGYQFNRRIVDHNRSSRGIHLNTTTTLPAQEPTDDVKAVLATLNVAKGAIFGSGGLLLDEKGRTSFHHSPRLSLTTEMAYNYAGYRHRPLIRYPFKPDGNLARVETVTADALNFAWPIRASLVVTNALFKLLEHGIEDLPRLRDPVRAAAVVGRYGHEKQIAVVRDGEYQGVRPLDVMREFCERFLVEDEKKSLLDTESRQVLKEIIVVSDMVTRDPESAAADVESIARRLAIYKKMDKEDVSIDSERMCRFDYFWDLLGGGIAEGIRQKNIAGWRGFTRRYSPSETKRRMVKPPQDTRAKIRGEVIRRDFGSNASVWDEIDLHVTEPSPARLNVVLHPLDNGDRLLAS